MKRSLRVIAVAFLAVAAIGFAASWFGTRISGFGNLDLGNGKTADFQIHVSDGPMLYEASVAPIAFKMIDAKGMTSMQFESIAVSQVKTDLEDGLVEGLGVVHVGKRSYKAYFRLTMIDGDLAAEPSQDWCSLWISFDGKAGSTYEGVVVKGDIQFSAG